MDRIGRDPEVIDGSLSATDLGTGSVGSSEVTDGSLSGTEIASNSVSTADLVGADVNGTISLSAGAVPRGECRQYDITVPGALKDQVAIISKRSFLYGILLIGDRVPANDTVTMEVCNLYGPEFQELVNFPIRVVTFG